MAAAVATTTTVTRVWTERMQTTKKHMKWLRRVYVGDAYGAYGIPTRLYDLHTYTHTPNTNGRKQENQNCIFQFTAMAMALYVYIICIILIIIQYLQPLHAYDFTHSACTSPKSERFFFRFIFLCCFSCFVFVEIRENIIMK